MLMIPSEENVWKMVAKAGTAWSAVSELRVLFISNARKAVPLWHQQRGNPDLQGLVLWDYHVILVGREWEGSEWLVWDLDSDLAFPIPFPAYFAAAIRSDADVRPEFHRRFAVVPGDVYLATFSSDRSHMRSEAGDWLSPVASLASDFPINHHHYAASELGADRGARTEQYDTGLLVHGASS